MSHPIYETLVLLVPVLAGYSQGVMKHNLATNTHNYKVTSQKTKTELNLLEEKVPILVAKERHSVRHHPDVAPATVEVRLAPLAVVVGDRQYPLTILLGQDRLVVVV